MGQTFLLQTEITSFLYNQTLFMFRMDVGMVQIIGLPKI